MASNTRQTDKGYTFPIGDAEAAAEYWTNSVSWSQSLQIWNEPIPLPDPCGEGELAAINIELLKFFERLKGLKKWGDLYINGTLNKITQVTSLVRSTSKIIAAILKTLVQRLRDYLIGKIRAGIQDLIDMLLPTVTKAIKNTIIQRVIDNILCKFKDIISGLIEMVGDFLFELIGKIVNVPFCAASQWTNGLINKLASDLDKALGPILDAINDVLGPVTKIVGNIFQALDFILGFESFLCAKPNCPEIKDFKADPFWGGPSQKDIDDFNSFLPVPSDADVISTVDGWTKNLPIFGGTLGQYDGTLPDSITNCDPSAYRCGPPRIEIFGGGGAGAAGKAVVDRLGRIIGVDLTFGGSNYNTPPFVSIVDNCRNGNYAAAYTIIDEDPDSPTSGQVIDIVITSPGGGYIPTPNGKTEFDLDDEDVTGDTETNDYVICLTGFEIISTGIGYKPTDSITITPNIPDLNAVVAITESGQILSIELSNRICGLTEIPSIDVDSDDGSGVDIKPIFEIVNVSDTNPYDNSDSFGAVCSTDSDCPPGQMCLNGRCVNMTCSIDTDCPTGFICLNGICVDENLFKDTILIDDLRNLAAARSSVGIVRVVDCVN